MRAPCRFPPPWSVEGTNACYIVRDHNGQALAYVYFEEEPGRRDALADPRRGAAHRGEHREVAGTARQGPMSSLVLHLHCAAAVHHRCCRARGSAGFGVAEARYSFGH
jgi:hypothetical protein